MKIIGLIRHIKHNWNLYIIILMVMVVSDDCYWFSTAKDESFVMIKFAFYVLFPLYLYETRGHPKINIVPIVLMTCLLCISVLLGGASVIGGPVVLFLLFVSSAIIAKAIELTDFANCFVEVVNALMAYSVLVWIGVMTGVLSINEIENVAGVSVKVSWLCIFFSDTFGVILRNSAIFREPGVFMVFINLAFILDAIFLKHRLSIKKLLLYVGCMITTLSTAGLIILLLAYLLYIYVQRKSIKSLSLPILFMGLCIALLIGSEELVGDIFSKFGRGMESGSVVGRITSLTIPAMIIFHNPLFGVGPELFRTEYIHYGEQLYHMYIDPQGLATNTILNAGAVYGLWFSLCLVVDFYDFSKGIAHNKRIQTLYVFLLLLMMFSNESMFYSMIVYILIFYGIDNRYKLLTAR